MYLFIGLGNPGPQYAKNRHNVGFLILDEIRQSYGFSAEKPKFNGLISEGLIDGHKVILFKPMTYMNKSGGPAAQLSNFYSVPLNHIFVFHDDLDLELGRIKIKQGGGAGGHNGLKSLDGHVGKDYWRVRIGIDRPEFQEDVASYVLKDFSKGERGVLDTVLPLVADECHLLLGSNPNDLPSKVMQDLKR